MGCIVEEHPEFPGGMSALATYIKENLRYPEEAKQKGYKAARPIQEARQRTQVGLRFARRARRIQVRLRREHHQAITRRDVE